MTALYRTVQANHEDLKKSSSLFGIKNLSIRHRNFSNSRLNAQRFADEQLPHQTIEHRKRNEETRSTNGSKELKKYCLDKMKAAKAPEQFNVLRKNRSLKVIFKDQSNKLFNRTKIEPRSCEELLDKKESHIPRQSTEKGQLISIKRRVELIKNNQNKMKLKIKDRESQHSKDQALSDVSLGERLDFFLPEQEKISSSNKIQSENVLGQGLKKCSSSKIKILVKNPFERMMRMEESRQNKKQSVLLEQNIEQLHQSQIPHFDNTISSFSNRCELEEMLALI